MSGPAIGLERQPLVGNDAPFHRVTQVQAPIDNFPRYRSGCFGERALEATRGGFSKVPFARADWPIFYSNRLGQDQRSVEQEPAATTDMHSTGSG